MQWHRISLTFNGPSACESDAYNPFVNYQMIVTFEHESGTPSSFSVPGFFAADGQAAETGAVCGNRWRVYFNPPRSGVWNWSAEMRQGTDLITLDGSGSPTAFHGQAGSFTVVPTNKSGPDFRSRGRLTYVGQRYLYYAGDKEPFLMSGAGSPENFLAYEDFDGTYNNGGVNYIKSYAPHLGDWQSGDPVWQGDKGKGIIGALNYMASVGVNAQYMLSFNTQGDGNDVWPFTGPTTYTRMDVSKLDQWEIVFEHMNSLGMVMHILLQEQENDQMMDGGAMGPNRKVYYRELIARFAHHPGLIWNLGEENTNTDAERKAHAQYIRELDAYRNHIQVHTYPWQKEQVYAPLLSFEHFEGASLQISSSSTVDSDTEDWLQRSKDAGRQWVSFLSEIGPSSTGVKPDDVDPEHNEVRTEFLWPHLMYGGSGVEWYFGFGFSHSDLTCEDYRSRHNMFVQTDHALNVFRQAPIERMQPDHERVSGSDNLCMSLQDRFHLIYLPEGETVTVQLDVAGQYAIAWYNPRTGGALSGKRLVNLSSAGGLLIDDAPDGEDWVLCVLRRNHGAEDALRIESMFGEVWEQGLKGAGQSRVFPNPGQDWFELEWFAASGDPLYDVRIVQSNGVVLRQIQTRDLHWSFDLGELPEGIYFFEIYTGSIRHSQGKLIKSGI